MGTRLSACLSVYNYTGLLVFLSMSSVYTVYAALSMFYDNSKSLSCFTARQFLSVCMPTDLHLLESLTLQLIVLGACLPVCLSVQKCLSTGMSYLYNGTRLPVHLHAHLDIRYYRFACMSVCTQLLVYLHVRVCNLSDCPSARPRLSIWMSIVD